MGEKERENVIWDDIYRLFLYYNEKKALKIKKVFYFKYISRENAVERKKERTSSVRLCVVALFRQKL